MTKLSYSEPVTPNIVNLCSMHVCTSMEQWPYIISMLKRQD